MLTPVYTKQFARDVKRITKRGKDTTKLKTVLEKLFHQEPLPVNYRNHPLKGKHKGCYDCHLEADWILIYRITEDCVQFIRTGSHADLFE